MDIFWMIVHRLAAMAMIGIAWTAVLYGLIFWSAYRDSKLSGIVLTLYLVVSVIVIIVGLGFFAFGG